MQVPSEIKGLQNFDKNQLDALNELLSEALKKIVGVECAFVVGFMPLDDTGRAPIMALALAKNIAAADALMVATDLVDQLKVCETAESLPMTRN